MLRRLVWEPIARHLPAGTNTLYLALDDDLARLPWCALPIAADRVLLEQYAVATAPHGLFLLEQLKFPSANAGPRSVLAVGDLTYDSKLWPALPGAKVEIAALERLAPATTVRLTGTDASAERLGAALSKVRYAHLATHGAFFADELAAEKKREQAAWKETSGFGQESRRVAAKNPLGFVGLALSRGEVLSGLSIVDLNLQECRLVTLSACETGLGEFTGGKGVENLQQAFHLAGCPNVVASLWKVNDAATAALMTKFYHELWANKKPPIEALREAQLTIYRHPELIPDLAGERGAPNLKAAVAVKIGEPSRVPPVADRVTDTRLWAAFVLSGVGK